MILWTRRLLTALVALAILAAPCLSALTPFGGAAHAVHLAVELVVHDGDHHAHHHSGGHDHAAGPQEGAPAAPPHDQVKCCCECDGWVVATAPAHVPAPAASSAKLQFDDKAHVAGLPPLQRVASTEGRSSPARGGALSIPVVGGRVYAVTGRLRI